MQKNIILNHQEIGHKIKRIAYQIYETFIDDTEIVIAGIASNGFEFAKKIAFELEIISPIRPILCKVFIDKNNPKAKISTSIEADVYENKSLVLVDDVLNSGTTLVYGVKHFLEVDLKKFKTAVLVDRNHKKYPVKVDFKGISLSTSLQEHVNVIFEKDSDHAFLS